MIAILSHLTSQSFKKTILSSFYLLPSPYFYSVFWFSLSFFSLSAGVQVRGKMIREKEKK